jgi:hypothetical protein
MSQAVALLRYYASLSGGDGTPERQLDRRVAGFLGELVRRLSSNTLARPLRDALDDGADALERRANLGNWSDTLRLLAEMRVVLAGMDAAPFPQTTWPQLAADVRESAWDVPSALGASPVAALRAVRTHLGNEVRRSIAELSARESTALRATAARMLFEWEDCDACRGALHGGGVHRGTGALDAIRAPFARTEAVAQVLRRAAPAREQEAGRSLLCVWARADDAFRRTLARVVTHDMLSLGLWALAIWTERADPLRVDGQYALEASLPPENGARLARQVAAEPIPVLAAACLGFDLLAEGAASAPERARTRLARLHHTQPQPVPSEGAQAQLRIAR